jgi:hypothetical protein
VPLFTRRTILAVTENLPDKHAEFERLLMEFSIEEVISKGYLKERSLAVAKYLLANPGANTPDGKNLTDEFVRTWVETTSKNFWSEDDLEKRYPKVYRALRADGFSLDINTKKLKPDHPPELNIAQANDEIHELLDKHLFSRSKGHLDQGISAHAQGDWAAANAQFRTYFESLLEEIAGRLATQTGKAVPATGQPTRQFLGNEGFFFSELNEWDLSAQSKGFIESLFKRLHPQGSHPGLSDQDDSTFRLHLVLLMTRLLLRRIRR